MSSSSWIPDEIPLDKPNSARMYDYLLGGYHNLEVDRSVADKMLSIYGDVRLAAGANRAFLGRAIEFMSEQGIKQFLDLGSGIPTVDNVHEVAQNLNPQARVVYVDIDPVAVAHSNQMLRDNPLATAIRGDVKRPQEILGHPEVQRLLDLDQPLGLLMVAILHYVVDPDKVLEVVGTFRDVLASGSYVAIAQGTTEYDPPEHRQLQQAFGAANKTRRRSRSEIERFFEGLELVEPGVVYTPLWRPTGAEDVLLDSPERSLCLGGVGYKA